MEEVNGFFTSVDAKTCLKLLVDLWSRKLLFERERLSLERLEAPIKWVLVFLKSIEEWNKKIKFYKTSNHENHSNITASLQTIPKISLCMEFILRIVGIRPTFYA